MLKKEKTKIIQKEIKVFFENMGFLVEAELSVKDKALCISLDCENPQILIGEKGTVLAHIQKLLQIILSKKLERSFYLNLDISDYKKKKIQYLKEMAARMADEVVFEKMEKALSPMLAYERRIIHLELANRGDVTTESIGIEPERKVVIRPYP